MPLKCVAIDDEPLALQLIREYVSRIPALGPLHTFENAVEGAEYLARNPVDLLFVDINMPDITGMDLVRSLKEKPIVIFTTAYKNYAYEGFELQALDYLLKPIDYKRFLAAAEKAIAYHKYRNAEQVAPDEECLYVYSEYRIVKVLLRDIEYIESMEDYIKIYLAGADKPVLTLMTLKKMLEKLPAEKFKRIHRSYIVSLGKVQSIHNRKVKLAGAELPVGDSYATFIAEWTQKT